MHQRLGTAEVSAHAGSMFRTLDEVHCSCLMRHGLQAHHALQLLHLAPLFFG